MNAETLSLIASFVSLLLVPCVVVLGVGSFKRAIVKSAWPAKRDLLLSCGISMGITLVITLVICLVFKCTGFFDSRFYRPSNRDYGQAEALGLVPEVVTFTSSDGTILRGWFLTAGEAAGTVIHFHGSDRNITHTVKNASWLTNHGLNVFVFDYRGYGASQGKPSRKGLVEDSVAAIEYVANRPDVDRERIVLWGQSMGGQLAINAASLWSGFALPLVVSEATYAKQSYHISDKISDIPPLWLVKWGAWLLTSDEFSGEEAISNLGRTDVLIVHGTSDRGVAPYHSDRLYRSASEPKKIWRFKSYGHLQIFTSEENQQRLADHILATLTPEPPDEQTQTSE